MKTIFIFLISFISLTSIAQVPAGKVRKAFMGELPGPFPELRDQQLVAQFYSFFEYELAWMESHDGILRKQLIELLESAETFGLEKADYQEAVVQSLQSGLKPMSLQDSIYLDIKLTDAAIWFFYELQYGNGEPSFRYAGMHSQPFITLTIWHLSEACKNHRVNGLALLLEPRSIEYRQAKTWLNRFAKLLQNESFREVRVISTRVNFTNQPLISKLVQLGYWDSTQVKDETLLVKALQQAQKTMDLVSDGKLRTTGLAALNISISRRHNELKVLLNTLRYLHGLRESGPLVVVNIPSADLVVYHYDSLALYSRMVVGKPTTPTPTLSSRINEVILYPYWHVPNNIATKELLPRIKKNPSYLEANNYQVLDQNGRVMNPKNINWKGLSASNFPYTLRQSTGCDNALGVLKFNFYNPFTVYLHDTPSKELFFMNRRYFSHGCMRVEKPVDLAQILLKEKASVVDSITRACLIEQKPRTIRLEESVPVLVLYQTAWYTPEGNIRFFEDCYKRNSPDKLALAKRQ
ncbi:MAG: L,D-transpeptidase family protein [Flavitalea sp.]